MQPCLSHLGPRWQEPASTCQYFYSPARANNEVGVSCHLCVELEWRRHAWLTVLFVFYINVLLGAPVLPTDQHPVFSRRGANVPERTHGLRWAHKRRDNRQDPSVGRKTVQEVAINLFDEINEVPINALSITSSRKCKMSPLWDDERIITSYLIALHNSNLKWEPAKEYTKLMM